MYHLPGDEKNQNMENLIQQEVPVRQWQIVAMYLFHFDGQGFFLIMDYYSKYSFVHKLKEFSSN